ncbi:minor capsid protein [Streptomyces chryseus]
MADPLDGLARLLDDTGHGTYAPTGTSGDLFIESMPAAPDVAVCLASYDAGSEPDTLNAYDTLRVQIKTRGGPDPRVSRTRAQEIYSELHGLAGIELPGGTWLILAAARGLVAGLGPDASGRHEHVVNFDLDVSAPTKHRTE